MYENGQIFGKPGICKHGRKFLFGAAWIITKTTMTISKILKCFIFQFQLPSLSLQFVLIKKLIENEFKLLRLQNT